MKNMLQVSLLALALATSFQAMSGDCDRCTPAEAAQCKAKGEASCAKKCPADGAKCAAGKATEGGKKSVPAPRPAPASPSTR